MTLQRNYSGQNHEEAKDRGHKGSYPSSSSWPTKNDLLAIVEGEVRLWIVPSCDHGFWQRLSEAKDNNHYQGHAGRPCGLPAWP